MCLCAQYRTISFSIFIRQYVVVLFLINNRCGSSAHIGSIDHGSIVCRSQFVAWERETEHFINAQIHKLCNHIDKGDTPPAMQTPAADLKSMYNGFTNQQTWAWLYVIAVPPQGGASCVTEGPCITHQRCRVLSSQAHKHIPLIKFLNTCQITQ